MLRSIAYFFNGLLILAAGGSLLTIDLLLLGMGLVIGLCAGVLNIALMAKPNVELFYARLGLAVNALATLAGLAIGAHAVRLLAGLAQPPEHAGAMGLMLIIFAVLCVVAAVLAQVVYGKDVRVREQTGESPRI